jgi:hypothetical protein
MPASHVMLALTQVLAAALGVLPAQGRVDEPRPTFALVKDAKGEPLAGATVTFAGCLPHVGVEYGPADVQHVESDERGRARARLRADLCYVAWATGPASVDGSRGGGGPLPPCPTTRSQASRTASLISSHAVGSAPRCW